MANIATITHNVVVEGDDGAESIVPAALKRFACRYFQRQAISLTGSAFTAFTVPTAFTPVFLIIRLKSTDVSLTLKGVTGDTGIAISPASSFLGLDQYLSLGTSPSVGIANGSATARVIEIIWLGN